jgi:hypothetical protein
MSVGLGALVLTAMLAAPGAAVGAPGGPDLVNGKKAGPVAIPVTQKTVASLPLTKGRWLVIAKAVLAGTGGSNGAHLGVECRLVLGSRSDRVTAAPTGQGLGGSRVPILLTTAGKLKGSGPAQLRCTAEVGAAVKIRDIRLTAIRVGTLTTRRTSVPAVARVGPSATSGSGEPLVISAKQGASASVDGDGTYQPVAALPLAAGRWWILAKGVGFGATADVSYRCRITADGDADVIGLPIGSPGTPGAEAPFALQVAHDFAAPGTALLECRGDHGFTLGNVVINALKVGTLTSDALPSPAATTGSGTPVVVSGWNDGPIGVPVDGTLRTVLSRPLSAGKWLVIAKASFEAEGVPADLVRGVACQLGFSGYKDDVELRYEDGISRVGSVVLQVPASSSGAQSAVLRCRRTDAGGTGGLLFVKITALKLGSILSWKI